MSGLPRWRPESGDTIITEPLFRYVPFALAASLLGACAGLPPPVGPDYVAPEIILPSTWSAAASAGGVEAGGDLARWWRQLGDPRLDGLIDEALAGSLDLRLAQARLRQARASREQAAGGLFPVLSGSAGASRSRSAASSTNLGTSFSAARSA